MNKSKWTWLVALQIIIMIALELLNLKVAIPAPNGADAAGYYAWGQSWLEDHDSDPTNQLANNINYPIAIINGRPVAIDKYPIGWSLAVYPFMQSAQLLAKIFNDHPLSGLAPAIVRAAWLGVYAWCICGMLAAYSSIRMLTNHQVSALAVALAWIGTSAFAYSWKSPGMAHGVGMSAISITFWCAAHARLSSRASLWAVAWGIVASLVVCIRLFDGLILIPSLILLLSRPQATLISQWCTRRNLLLLPLVALGAAPLLFFQAWIWHSLYGTWYFNGYAENHEGFAFNPANLARFLLSTQKGLLLWHPITILALWGLVVSSRTAFADTSLKIVARGAFVVSIAMILLYGSWSFWSLGDSYGARWTADLFWIWALGLASLFYSATKVRLPNLVRNASILALIGFVWMAAQIANRVPLDDRLTVKLPHFGSVRLP